MHVYDIVRRQALRLQTDTATWAHGSGWRQAGFEFVLFGIKQAWACLYGGAMLALLVGTMLFWPREGALLSRYDFLFLASIGLQALLIVLKLERWDEVKVIFAFHVVGTIMELFKTHVGSWTYPGDAFFRIGGVPLFTGFMYACVGSYLARATRLFDLRYSAYPPFWMTAALAVLAYLNFFGHHFGPDFRWALFALSGVLFWRTRVYFTVFERPRWMPLLAGFLLIALFIWFAENVGTFTGAWLYPHQKNGWEPVGAAKLGSWYLLMILSFVLVTTVHRPAPYAPAAQAEAQRDSAAA